MKIRLTCFLLMVTFSCTDEKNIVRPYPDIITSVSAISTQGATFEAKVLNHSGPVSDKGFIWYYVQESIETKSLGSGEILDNSFLLQLTSRLKASTTYTVRAYVVVDGVTIYGSMVSFESQGSAGPIISDFTPGTAHVYDTISITGTGFSTIKGMNVVKFGGVTAGVLNISENLLKVAVPDISEDDNPFEISVSTVGTETTATAKFLLSPASPISADKNSIKLCETLTLTADALPPEGYSSNIDIYFNDTPTKPYFRGGSTLKVNLPFIPINTTNITVKLVIGHQERVLSGIIDFRAPAINSFSPAIFSPLSTLTVYGENFPACGFKGRIGTQSIAFKNISDTQFTFVVPAGVNAPFELQLLMDTNYLTSYTFE